MRSELVALLFGASSALASSLPMEVRQGGCATGVHIILARGTNEILYESVMEETAAAVKDAIPGSDSEEVVYPATDDLVSQKIGYDATEGMIADYASSCPNTKIVLMGFSQGGWIMSDVACGKSSFSLPGKRSTEDTNLAVRQTGLQNGMSNFHPAHTARIYLTRISTRSCDARRPDTCRWVRLGYRHKPEIWRK
jgi:hypothetical protein